LKRALNYPPKANQRLAKREELEEMFRDVWARRKDALKDIKENGLVIRIERSNARGAIYESKIINPAVKVAQACERQLTSLAKLMKADEEPEAPKRELTGIEQVEQIIAGKVN
jgi:hypothetical protein